jgi:hypothetical protein
MLSAMPTIIAIILACIQVGIMTVQTHDTDGDSSQSKWIADNVTDTESSSSSTRVHVVHLVKRRRV